MLKGGEADYSGIAKGAGARVEDLFRREEGKTVEKFPRPLASWPVPASNSTPFLES